MEQGHGGGWDPAGFAGRGRKVGLHLPHTKLQGTMTPEGRNWQELAGATLAESLLCAWHIIFNGTDPLMPSKAASRPKGVEQLGH